MMKYFLMCLMALGSPAAFSSEQVLQDLLTLKPGSKIDKKIKSSETGKDFSYEVEQVNGFVESVKIDFSLPKASDSYLKSSTKGFCMIQKPAGDVALNRYFFFDLINMKRYELTKEKKIKSILIQDIPGARENTPCVFSKFNLEKKI